MAKSSMCPIPLRSALQTDPSEALAQGALHLAAGWMRQCGTDLRMRARIRLSELAAPGVHRAVPYTPEQRALLAAACELVDLVAQTPYGRQALRDLGLEPLPQEVEGPECRASKGYVIRLDLLPDGVRMRSTRPDGSFDSSYAPLPDERIPVEVGKLLAELRAQSAAGS